MISNSSLEVINRIKQDFEDAHVGRLKRYLTQPSISALNLGVQEMAELLSSDIEELGGVSRVVQTSELPVVFAKLDEGADKTLLLHGLYDVTPADEESWTIPPFEPEIRNVEGIGRSIIGRGAEDMKTPIASAMNVIASYRELGKTLPVNLIMVFEASELGSGGIRDFVNKHQKEMLESDLVLWLCPMAHSNGVPIVPLSIKGNLMGRLICKGGDWGGPVGNEMHALNSNWVGNPATRLSEAIVHIEHSLERDYAQGRGWCPSDSQIKLANNLMKRLNEQQIKTLLGVSKFKYHDFADALMAHLFRPQFTVVGIRSGFVGEGKSIKISIPSDAEAAVNMRFQPGETPDQGISRIKKILDDGGFQDIVFEVFNAYSGGGASPDDKVVQCVLDVHNEMGANPEVWPVHPIGIPVSIWTDRLKLPWIGGLPCHAGNKHAANEYAQISGILSSEEFLVRLMDRIAVTDL